MLNPIDFSLILMKCIDRNVLIYIYVTDKLVNTMSKIS